MTSQSSKVSLIKILLIFTIFQIHFGDACSNAGRNAGLAAAEQTRKAMDESSKRVEAALTKTAGELTNTINTAVKSLENAANNLGKSVEISAKELSGSIKKASDDLVKIADKVTNSIDKGVEELGKTVREAIDASKEISKTLAGTIDKAVVEVGKQIEHATNTLQKIVNNLTDSLDKAVAEMGKTMRYIADSIVEVAKNFNLRVDSGDLVEVAQVTKDGLVDAVTVLSTNWEVAVKTADLKDVGASAAAELSKAMQNINVKLVVRFEMDDNFRESVKYISIAGGIAFSVFFVAIIVSLKSCRSCTVSVFSQAVRQCESRRGRDEEVGGSSDDEEAHGKTKGESSVTAKKRAKTKNGKSTEMKEINRKKSDTTKKQLSGSDSEDLSDVSLDSLSGEKKKKRKGFSKRDTLSLADYKKYPTLQKKWERKSQRTLAQQKEANKQTRLLDVD